MSRLEMYAFEWGNGGGQVNFENNFTPPNIIQNTLVRTGSYAAGLAVGSGVTTNPYQPLYPDVTYICRAYINLASFPTAAGSPGAYPALFGHAAALIYSPYNAFSNALAMVDTVGALHLWTPANVEAPIITPGVLSLNTWHCIELAVRYGSSVNPTNGYAGLRLDGVLISEKCCGYFHSRSSRNFFRESGIYYRPNELFG
jgi:hypothetical protein